MLINLLAIAMTVFVLFVTGVMVTVIAFALKQLHEIVDVACWNAMIRHEIKKWRKRNEKH